MEREFTQGNERRANRGQFLAYSLVIVAFTIGLVCVLTHSAGAGAAIIGAAFAGGVILYIAGGVPRANAPAKTQTNQRDSARAQARRARKTSPPQP